MQSGRASLARLLHLSSPALPVGAYSYSQGMEWAIHRGTVRDERSALAWIEGLMKSGTASFEAAYLGRFLAAWSAEDPARVASLNEEFLASRESAELRSETLQMGYSLQRLLHQLGGFPREALEALSSMRELSYPTAWSCAAAMWRIEPEKSTTAYLWTWLENQVTVAMKAVPLGQAAGQRILFELGEQLSPIAEAAIGAPDEELTNLAPSLAIASSRHETQYSRLFRS